MTTFERRQTMVELMRKQPGMHVPELAASLGVSEGTVRNDLNALEAEGQLTRVRGGAVLTGEYHSTSPSFSTRLGRNSAAKQNIARCAAELVSDGDSILLDASTTVYSIARYLQNRQRLRVVTNGIDVARLLAQNPTHTVILLGGVVNPDGASVMGSLSEPLIGDLHFQTAFVSCSGFRVDVGLTDVHLEEAQLKRRAIESAQQIVALVDSSKFGKVDLTPFARTSQISHLFTDDQLSSEWTQALMQACINFTLCGEESAWSYSPCESGKKRYRIGFANQSERLPFAVDVRRGLEQAALEAGNVDLVLADNQLDPDAALKVAEDFLSQKLDLVIEYQIDEQTGNRILSKFKAARIPVISVDIPMVGATYFGVDNYRAGLAAGEALGDWLRLHWNGDLDLLIALVEPRAGAVPASRIQGQLEGLQAVLGPVPAEKRLELNCGNTREVSRSVVREALLARADQHRIAILSFNDEAALGALSAARDLGREEDIAVVGLGADRAAREELHRPGSRLIGSTAFFPEKYGEQLLRLALKILHGEPVPPAETIEHGFVWSDSELEPSR